MNKTLEHFGGVVPKLSAIKGVGFRVLRFPIRAWGLGLRGPWDLRLRFQNLESRGSVGS